MMPGRYDFEIYRGDDWSEDFKIYQPGSSTLAMDLTGFTASAAVKDDPTKTPVDATMTITFASPRSTGIITAAIASDALIVGTFFYDIQLTNASSKKQTYIYGTIMVRQDVTRP
jgi:hypothetical protein